MVGITHPPIQWVLWSYLEVKLQVHEGGRSPLASPEVMNEWSYATTPPIRMHGMESGKLLCLTFTYEFASQTVGMLVLL
jgi:hypothetical protein